MSSVVITHIHAHVSNDRACDLEPVIIIEALRKLVLKFSLFL